MDNSSESFSLKKSQESKTDSEKTIPLDMEFVNQGRNEAQVFGDEILNGAEIENVNLQDRRFIDFRINQSQDSQLYLRNHGEGADISSIRYSTLHQAIYLGCSAEVIEFILQNGGEIYTPQNDNDVSTESFARHLGVSAQVMNLLRGEPLQQTQESSQDSTQISQDLLATPITSILGKRRREDEVRRQDTEETYFEEEEQAGIISRSRSLRGSISASAVSRLNTLSNIQNIESSQESQIQERNPSRKKVRIEEPQKDSGNSR